MTIQHHQPSGYEDLLIDVIRALEVLDNLGETLCVAEPIYYARAHGLPQEIIDRLQKVSAAVSVLLDDGVAALWDFAKAANMADELIERDRCRR